MALSLNQFLTLYTWFLLTALLVIMLLIGRFYEKFSGRTTSYRAYLLPILLFGFAAVRYSSVGRAYGDTLGDWASALGGLTLIALCVRLYWLMMGRQTWSK
jgi:hypothetical protein